MEEKQEQCRCDVAVIGGGAAGLVAAQTAARRGLSVAVIERAGRCAKKILITGKGRCNVVNNCSVEQFMEKVRSGGRFLYSALTAFGPQEIMAYFEALGVPLKTERGGRVFPVSDRAADIADALIRAAGDARCTWIPGRAVSVQAEDGQVAGVVLEGGRRIACRAAIVATGGLSYPRTGSTGDGYSIARQLGHTIEPLRASLVPLVCAGEDCAAMQGLSLKNVVLRARRGKRVLFQEQGEMLFTHFGVSGPLVLSLSAAAVGSDWGGLAVSVDLKPALDVAALDRRLLRDFSENRNREFRNALDALLPRRMIPVVVARSGIDPHRRVNAVTAAQRAALAQTLKEFALPVTGTRPVEEAIVTAGGVRLSEIEPRTMQSKLLRRLHFAGEVLDADGYTGGFNLGIAFSTGRAAGAHVLEAEGDNE